MLSHPPKGQGRGRGKAKAKPKPKAKAQAHESTVTPAGANAAWALEEEGGLDGVFDELSYVTSASAWSFYTTFLPTFHAASTQDTSIEDHPDIVVCYAGKKYVLLHANVVHHLPLVTKKELRVILSAIHDFTVKGELWNIHKWNAALNKTLDELFWTNPDWSPPVIALKMEEIKESEVMFSSFDASTPDIDINLLSPPKTYNVEDLDAETEQEEDDNEDGMTRKEAQEIIMRHSLPKAVSRENVQLPGYVPEG